MFGDPGQAWHWLNRLAEKTPLEVIETDSGFHPCKACLDGSSTGPIVNALSPLPPQSTIEP